MIHVGLLDKVISCTQDIYYIFSRHLDLTSPTKQDYASIEGQHDVTVIKVYRYKGILVE